MRSVLILAAVVATLALSRPAAAQGNVIQGGGAGASQRNFSLNFGGGFGGGVGAAVGRGFNRVGIGGTFGLGRLNRGLAFGRGLGFNRGFSGYGVGARNFAAVQFAPVYQQRQVIVQQQVPVYVEQQQVIVRQQPVYTIQAQQFAAPVYAPSCGAAGIRAQVGGCAY